MNVNFKPTVCLLQVTYQATYLKSFPECCLREGGHLSFGNQPHQAAGLD